MVSSVFVLLSGDAGEAPSRTTDCVELGKTIGGSDGALGVCEEDIARMEIKAWHAINVSRERSPVESDSDICSGEQGIGEPTRLI